MQSKALQKQSSRIWPTSTASEMQAGRSQIRPQMRGTNCHPEPPKVEIPIVLAWVTAGSGIADFPTPDGVRNSKRLPTGRFGAPKLEKPPFAEIAGRTIEPCFQQCAAAAGTYSASAPRDGRDLANCAERLRVADGRHAEFFTWFTDL